MSIWSGIKSFVGGLCSAVKDAFSAVGKVLAPIVEKTIECIAPILQNSELMQKLVPLLAVVIPPPYDVVAVVVVEVLCALCGKEEKPEELGYQMNVADKSPDEFDSFKEYREYLDANFPFDKEKFEALDDTHKSACRITGIAGALTDVKEATGKDISPNVIGAFANVVKERLLPEAKIADFVRDVVGGLESKGVDPMAAIDAYTKQVIAPNDFDSLMASCESALAKGSGPMPALDEVMPALSNPYCSESDR